MGLAANPDFRRWLERYAAGHARLHGDAGSAASGRCDGCGDPLPTPLSRAPFCIVCLAEQYGRDRAQAAERVAGALRLAIAAEPDVSLGDVRAAVEGIFAAEAGCAAAGG